MIEVGQRFNANIRIGWTPEPAERGDYELVMEITNLDTGRRLQIIRPWRKPYHTLHNDAVAAPAPITGRQFRALKYFMNGAKKNGHVSYL